ncbi:MAG TPA: SCO family protein [Thermoanaerobaculia bacterium]|nr:SCO family protein [Thermoanaerobaculia bacterium]
MNLRRGLLWGFLIVALLVVAGAAAWQILHGPEPPPVLGAVPDFALVNRDGQSVRRADLAGAPWIADFIFTRCGASCPMMSLRMARLERELPRDLGVRFVSVSVDPGYDTPKVLQEYAESFGAPGRWLFLTGDKRAIHRLSKEGFKLAVDDASPVDRFNKDDEPILHSTRFVLVDGEGRIRGYYEAFDEQAVKKLMRDVEALAG